MLKKNDLIEYFFKGIKDKNNLKIGVEHEKFVLNKKNFRQVSYEMPYGIKDILLKRKSQKINNVARKYAEEYLNKENILKTFNEKLIKIDIN